MVETCRNTVTFERFPRRWMGSDLEMFWPWKSQELWAIHLWVMMMGYVWLSWMCVNRCECSRIIYRYVTLICSGLGRTMAAVEDGHRCWWRDVVVRISAYWGRKKCGIRRDSDKTCGKLLGMCNCNLDGCQKRLKDSFGLISLCFFLFLVLRCFSNTKISYEKPMSFDIKEALTLCAVVFGAPTIGPFARRPKPLASGAPRW